MSNYDDSELGVENPNHPANQIEVIELTEEEIELQDLKMSVKELQRINKNMQRILSEEGLFIVGKESEQYIKLQELFNHKLNKL